MQFPGRSAPYAARDSWTIEPLLRHFRDEIVGVAEFAGNDEDRTLVVLSR